MAACVAFDPGTASKVLLSSNLFAQVVDSCAAAATCTAHHVALLHALLREEAIGRKFAHFAEPMLRGLVAFAQRSRHRTA